MKVRMKATTADGVVWEGQKPAQTTADWCVEKGYVKFDKGAGKELPAFELIPEDAIPPNGIEYVTDVIGTERVRLSGRGLRVQSGDAWVDVPEGHAIVEVNGVLSVIPPELIGEAK